MVGINDPFSGFGHRAKAKVLLLGPLDILPVNVMDQVRSLNIEHVSLAGLMRHEISRRRTFGSADETTLALLRRWFFARKPDAGFVLLDFPATMLQAQVFGEWLETRDETLDAVFSGHFSHPVVSYYRTLGLFFEEVEPVTAST